MAIASQKRKRKKGRIRMAMPYKTDRRQSHRSVKTKWSANKVETTGETTLDHRLSCTENGKSYW